MLLDTHGRKNDEHLRIKAYIYIELCVYNTCFQNNHWVCL